MPLILRAVEAYASVGEISDRFGVEVFGSIRKAKLGTRASRPAPRRLGTAACGSRLRARRPRSQVKHMHPSLKIQNLQSSFRMVRVLCACGTMYLLSCGAGGLWVSWRIRQWQKHDGASRSCDHFNRPERLLVRDLVRTRRWWSGSEPQEICWKLQDRSMRQIRGGRDCDDLSRADDCLESVLDHW